MSQAKGSWMTMAVLAAVLAFSSGAAASTGESRTDENAATGLLVVQICRLRTLSRKVSQAAPP